MTSLLSRLPLPSVPFRLDVGKVSLEGVGEVVAPRRQVLRLVDDLLVNRVGGVAHDDAVLSGVDLGVEGGVADKVDDPSLGVVRLHIELLRQGLDVDLLVDPAVVLENEHPCLLHEEVGLVVEEEVGCEDALAGLELLLGSLEVEFDVKAVYELDDGVGVVAVLDELYEVLEVEPLPLVDDDGGCEVAEEVRGVGLDGLDVLLVHIQINNGIKSLLGVVPEDEEPPVEKPSPVRVGGDGGWGLMAVAKRQLELYKQISSLLRSSHGLSHLSLRDWRAESPLSVPDLTSMLCLTALRATMASSHLPMRMRQLSLPQSTPWSVLVMFVKP